MSADSFPLLLPGHHEYFRDGMQPQLSAEKIGSILNINQHGTGLKACDMQNSSTLFPTVSMMNHSSHPNCLFLPVSTGAGGPVIVVASNNAKKGEELTMLYHENAAS
ncbi:MAG: hypothetical protein SGARI_006432, partial [Bacillariaceae sp.]